LAARSNLLNLLKLEGQSVATSIRSGTLRRALTVVEISLAVVLLVAGVAYVRSYQALLAQDKGFDSSGVVAIDLTISPQAYSTAGARSQLRQQVVEALRARPGVLAASGASAPPDMGAAFSVHQIEIDGRGPVEESDLTIAELDVEPDYFSVLRVPVLSGRMFEPGDGPTDMIVSETFAAKYWPGQPAVGHSYRRDPRTPWRRVIGVVGHVRSPNDPPGGRSSRILQTYYLRQPPPPPRPSTAGSRGFSTGGSYGFVAVMARVDSRSRGGDLFQTIRAMDSSFILSLDFVDDEFAKNYENRLLATRVVGGFGILAFLVAAAGIYSLMTFLVAQRTREIGVRVALGATRRDIRRLLLGSSMKLTVAGAVAGVAGAWLTARWIESQLYGVRTLDPLAVASVSAGVLLVALVATWRPVRRATRVDATVLLRQ
jgi:predicted permease